MSIYKPTELRQFLDSLGAKAKKSLSQNFLIDGNILRKITDVAEIKEDDLVLEIGPGPGALTQILLEKRAHVIAVEKDKLFAEHLNRLDREAHLETFCEDILDFPIIEILKTRLKPQQKAKVVANLPYQLTTPILTRLMPLHQHISTITVMVQEEMARRMTAIEGTADYSSFTIFLRFYSDPKYAFMVSRNCFYPVPKVESAIVNLHLKMPPIEEVQATAFFHMVRSAFQKRRKMLKASLKDIASPEDIKKILEELHLDSQSRPEILSLNNFLYLFNKLKNLN